MAQQYAKDQPRGFVNYIQKVAIVGASGQLGRHLTEHILGTGKHTVTALTRKDGKATFPDGVKVAPVDYTDESTLVSALQGQDFLIITLAFTPDQPVIHDRIVRAAVKAGVKHLMPNIYTADIVFDNKAIGEETVTGSAARRILQDVKSVGDISWTVLVNGLWYDFSVAAPSEFLGFDIRAREVTMFDDGRRKINLTTWQQTGRAVASFLSLKKLPVDEQDTNSTTLSQFVNKPLYVSSFLIDQRSILDSLERVSGTRDADWKISYESTSERVAEGMKEAASGNLMGLAKAYYARLHYPGNEAIYEEKVHNDLLGLPREEIDEATKAVLEMIESGWSLMGP